MIDRNDLLKKISVVNEENKEAFSKLCLEPNLIFSYIEDEDMVLAEHFFYGPEGRKRKTSKLTPEDFNNTFFKD